MTLNWQCIENAPKDRVTKGGLTPCILVTRSPCSTPDNPPLAIVRWARITNSKFGWKHKGRDEKLQFTPYTLCHD